MIIARYNPVSALSPLTSVTVELPNIVDANGDPLLTRSVNYTANAPSGNPRLTHSLQFNGTAARGSTQIASTLVDNSCSFTAWIRPTGTLTTNNSVAYRLFSAKTGASGSLVFGINASKLAFGRRQSATFTMTSGANDITADVWTHVALVYNKSAQTITAYINGSTTGAPSVSSAVVDTIASPLDIIIGADYSTGTPDFTNAGHFNRFFAGDIANVQIFNHALTADEVSDIYLALSEYFAPTRPGKSVVGWQSLHGDDESDDVDVLAAVGGSVVFNDTVALGHAYDNANGYTHVGYAVPFVVEADDVGEPAYVSARPSSGSSATVVGVRVVEPEKDNDVCEQWGCNQHSAPSGVWFRGDFVQAVIAVGEPGAYLRVNGEMLLDENDEPASILADAAITEVRDTYHRACSLHVMDAGIVALSTDHQSRIYMRAAATAAGLIDATTVLVSPDNGAYASTYIQVTNGYTADQIAYAYRAGANFQYHIRLIEPFDANPQSTIVADVICNNDADTHRPYPRELQMLYGDTGQPVLFWSFLNRDDSDTSWGEVACGIRESDGQIYNLRGQTVGGTTNGTTSSPKLTNGQAYATAYTENNVCQILGKVTGGNRYPAQFILPRLTGWGSGGRSADAVILFADTSDVQLAAATDLRVRLCFYDGSTGTRYITPADSDPFGFDNGPSYRIAAHGWWRDGNPQTGIVDLVIGVSDIALPSQNGGYYAFGTDRKLIRFEVDLNGVASDADLAAGIKRLYAIDSETEHFATLQRTNIASRFIVDRSRVAIHDTLRVGSTLNGVIDLTGTRP